MCFRARLDFGVCPVVVLRRERGLCTFFDVELMVHRRKVRLGHAVRHVASKAIEKPRSVVTQHVNPACGGVVLRCREMSQP